MSKLLLEQRTQSRELSWEDFSRMRNGFTACRKKSINSEQHINYSICVQFTITNSKLNGALAHHYGAFPRPFKGSDLQNFISHLRLELVGYIVCQQLNRGIAINQLHALLGKGQLK